MKHSILIGCSEAAYLELCRMSVYKMQGPQQQQLQNYHYQLAKVILIERNRRYCENRYFAAKLSIAKIIWAMAIVLHINSSVRFIFFFVLVCSGVHTDKTNLFIKQLVHRRYRRGLGYRTICIEKPKTFCTMIEYGGALKKYCITTSMLHCTALD